MPFFRLASSERKKEEAAGRFRIQNETLGLTAVTFLLQASAVHGWVLDMLWHQVIYSRASVVFCKASKPDVCSCLGWAKLEKTQIETATISLIQIKTAVKTWQLKCRHCFHWVNTSGRKRYTGVFDFCLELLFKKVLNVSLLIGILNSSHCCDTIETSADDK